MMKMKRKKGQVELVAIAGLIIIVLIAMFLIMQQFMVRPPPSPGTGPETKTIKDSVNNFIRAGLTEIMAGIYSRGGYSSLAGIRTVKFGGRSVPVWQVCGNTEIPDVEEEIGEAVGKYIRENLGEEMQFFGKEVRFDLSELRSEARILEDSVEAEVYLPTVVEGFEVSSSYIASVDSGVKEVLDFSSGFAGDSAETRFFETVSLATLFFSDSDRAEWTPLVGMSTECGEHTVKRRDQILSGVVDMAEYVASHTVWNTEAARSASNPFFTLNSAGGKRHDLEVMFSYSREWDMDSNLDFSPDPVKIAPKPIKIDLGIISLPLPRMCIDVYGVTYSFRYPIVVSVRDEVTGQWFSFALMVEVSGNEPGECSGDLAIPGKGRAKEICGEESECRINLTVTDSMGNPLEGADIFFYECDLGSTGPDGNLITYAPCGIGEVKVYKDGYKPYGNLTSYHHLTNTTVILPETHNLTVHFFGVRMRAFNMSYNGKSITEYDKYRAIREPVPITELGGKLVNLVLSPVEKDIFTGEDTDIMVTNVMNYTSGERSRNATTWGVVGNTYEISGQVKERADSGKADSDVVMGHVSATLEITDQTDLYVYYPVVERFEYDPVRPYVKDVEDSICVEERDQMLSKLREDCGIEPVSFEEQDYSEFDPSGQCMSYRPG